MTDWDKELAKIDKQLESTSDQVLLPEPKDASPAQQQRVSERRARTSTFGAFARLVLAVVVGVAILFWPYSARCGLGLAAYLGAVLVVIVAGGWSAVWTWKHHTARAHVLSLLIVLWGLVLAAGEVLPRVGYAIPTAERPAAWACQ